jgi:glycosyltransferase involved in cell wall biosynthesis
MTRCRNEIDTWRVSQCRRDAGYTAAMPLVSVLVPVRDAAPWLELAFASLLGQTLADLEVVAIDDGSRDDSGERLDRIARRDPRLRVFHTPPRGLPAALNLALTHARAPLVARHDADDVSHRRRLEFQAAWLAQHAGVAVLGTRVRLFPRAGAGMRRWAAWHNGLLTHDEMAREVLIDSPLLHGTAMIRRSWLERVGGWTGRDWPEDLDLWIRMIESGARLAKLPRTLYGWRQHASSATRVDPRYRRPRFDDLRLAALKRGVLDHRRRIALVGVGTSLAHWRRLLEANGYDVDVLVAPRPDPRVVASIPMPAVLVFGAAASRARWRAALTGHEGRDFAFVASFGRSQSVSDAMPIDIKKRLD